MTVQVRIGVIGLGNYARGYHLPNLQSMEDVRVTGLCDVSAEAIEGCRSSFPEAALFTDYQELVDSGLVDAVIVSTPHHLHYPQARYALERGLHVLVDKPLTRRSAEAEELVDLAHRKGRVLMTAFNRHFDPGSLYVREAISSGRLGRLVLLDAVQRYLRDDYWYADPDVGGGMLHIRGSHIADLFPWLTGRRVVEVQARVHYDERGLDRASTVWMNLEGGIQAQLTCLVDAERYEDVVTVYGSRQSLRLERPPGSHGAGWRVRLSTGDACWEPVGALPPGSTSTANFVDAVAGRDAPRATAYDGLAAVRVIEAAHLSARTGRPVAVAP